MATVWEYYVCSNDDHVRNADIKYNNVHGQTQLIQICMYICAGPLTLAAVRHFGVHCSSLACAFDVICIV